MNEDAVLTNSGDMDEPKLPSYRERLLKALKEGGDLPQAYNNQELCKVGDRYKLLPLPHLCQQNIDKLPSLKSLLCELESDLLSATRASTGDGCLYLSPYMVERFTDTLEGGAQCLKRLGFDDDKFCTTTDSPDAIYEVLADLVLAKCDSKLDVIPNAEIGEPTVKTAEDSEEVAHVLVDLSDIQNGTSLSLLEDDAESTDSFHSTTESPRSQRLCSICLLSRSGFVCETCTGKSFCVTCDKGWHSQTGRQGHIRIEVLPVPGENEERVSEGVTAGGAHSDVRLDWNNLVIASRVDNVGETSEDTLNDTFKSALFGEESDLSWLSYESATEEEDVTTETVSAVEHGDWWACAHCTYCNEAKSTQCSICTRDRHITDDKRRRFDEQFSKIHDVITKIRTCESQHIPVTCLEACLNVSGAFDLRGENMSEWLVDSWPDILTNMAKEAANLVKEMHPVAPAVSFSTAEVMEALQRTRGDTQRAVDVCISRRMEKVSHISRLHPYLSSHEAEIHLAISEVGYQDQDILSFFNKGVFKEGVQLAPSSYDEAGDHVVKVIREKLVNKSTQFDVRVCIASIELKIASMEKAHLIVQLLNDSEVEEENMPFDDVLRMTISTDNFERAKTFLMQKCGTCYCCFPKDMMTDLPYCGCQMCVDCFIGWIASCCQSKQADMWSCPVCSGPSSEDASAYEDHLRMLQMLVENRSDTAQYRELFLSKVTIWSIMPDPHFRWCAHKCGNGFIYEGNNPMMECHVCGNFTCRDCKKAWEREHQGKTCEQFEEWKTAQDPVLARLLEAIGIECPKCKARFELSRGGCLHFKCKRCHFEFCCGCREAFLTGAKCTKFATCAGLGFHAHHPRNCFANLRDWERQQLEQLLHQNGVDYQPPGQASGSGLCRTKESKETVNGLVDEDCGKPVVISDLCESHYKEYLTSVINRHHLDPVDLMSEEMIQAELNRSQLMCRSNGLQQLRQFVRENLPLPKLK